MEVKVVTVSKETARQWLAREIPNNRRPSEYVITQYRQDMDAGRWVNAGDPIKFDTNGALFDGAQRLRAFLASRLRTIDLFVATGLPPEAVDVTDSGRKRTLGNVLQMHEARNAVICAAVVRRAALWDRGNYVGTIGRTAPRTVREAPPRKELLDRYLKDPTPYDTAAARGADVARLLNEKHPALVLAKRLYRRDSDDRVGPAQSILWIRAWNAYREDRPLGSLVIAPQDYNNATFPKPR